MRAGRALPALLAAALAAPGLAGEGGPPPGLHPLERELLKLVEKTRVENAAVHYLRACLLLPPPEGREEKVDYFITGPLMRCPPEVLKKFPKAAEEAFRYRRAVKRMQVGAAMKDCNFGTDWAQGAAASMEHAGHVRDLARRAAAYGKYLEFQGWEGPEDVYLDVVRMGCHLDQNSTIIQQLVSMSIVGIGTRQLQSMMSRGASAWTARRTLEVLGGLPDRSFDVAGAVDRERVAMGTWVLKELRDALEKDGAAKFKKGLQEDLLLEAKDLAKLPEDKEELRKLLNKWVDEYDQAMKHLAEVLDGPYYKVRAEAGKTAAELEARGKAGNYFLLMAPGVMRIKLSAARNEARLRATRLLAAACLEKARTGKYPGKLEALKKHFPRGLPVDPFSGRDFVYRLEEGLPAVESQGESPEAKKKRPQFSVFSLSDIKKREKKALERWPKEWREFKEEFGDEGQPGPAPPDPGEVF